MSAGVPSPLPGPLDGGALERRYRRLLGLYPQAWRAARLEEVLAVLLACAEPGRTRPGVRDGATVPPVSITELDESPHFGPVTRTDFPWREVYDAARYVALLGTQSDHRMLPEDQRRRLLDGVNAVIDTAGGELTVDYVAQLYRTRREP